jgi:hypothetical protein
MEIDSKVILPASKISKYVEPGIRLRRFFPKAQCTDLHATV